MPSSVDDVKSRVKSAMSEPLLKIDPKQRQAIMNDSSWADGLRGIASIYVVASHIVLCVARSMVPPCCGPDGSSRLYQRPVMRLFAQGHAWVALFFILMGFVNALKPIKLARGRQTETALSNLAVSAFRRTFRLILPASAATIISWFVCQLGLYETSRNGDAYWLYTYTPMMSKDWTTAFGDLIYGLRMTWSFNDINAYDQPQWALVYLLEGSVFIFLSLLMTITLTTRWRMIFTVGFALWSMDWTLKARDPLVGFTCFGGIILAELFYSDIVHTLAPISPIITPPLVLFSLVLMSYPSDFAENAPWSASLQRFSQRYFNGALNVETARGFSSIGGLCLVFAIMISPHARRLMTRKPLLWLGKISFPLYLLHGTFLRTVFAWILFKSQPTATPVTGGDGKQYQIERYPQGGDFWAWLGIIVSMGLCLVASHYWTKKVEPKFGQITKRAEDIMTGKAGSNGTNGNGMLPLRKETKE